MHNILAYICMDSHWSCELLFPIMLVLGYVAPIVVIYLTITLALKARRFRSKHGTLKGFNNELGILHKIYMALVIIGLLAFLYNELIVY